VNKLIIASNNLGKSQELTTYFKSFAVAAVNYQDLHEKIQFPPELADYRANALQKARFIQGVLKTDLPVLGDDSGIELAALPGHFQTKTHREFDQHGSLSHSAYILQLLKDQSNRGIILTSYLVLCQGPRYLVGEGHLAGQVALKAQGTHGFDLDQIVIPKGASQTLAEMTTPQRQRYAQREQAIENLMRNWSDQQWN
jgi:XTP/dITP diphosphohydrolase